MTAPPPPPPPPPDDPDMADIVDAAPRVGEDRGNAALWIGIVAILLIGASLFVAIETRRQRLEQPVTRQSFADGAAVQPYQPPPLILAEPAVTPPPAEVEPEADVDAEPVPVTPQPPPGPPPPSPPPAYPPSAYLPSRLQAMQTPPPPPSAAGQASAANAVVYDATVAETTSSAAGGSAAAAGQSSRSSGPGYARRGRSTRLTTIVPRGTLILAVLETALDSTQPGQARALISEDVYNLAGDRVLIPRGSRLFGDYRADLAAGQKRAFVQWRELMRPDGAVIAIESPATDPLGRAGVRGKVNSHFASRLGGALLQSAIDFGTLAAAQSVGRSAVVIANPVTQAGTSQLVGAPPKPTLSVRQGTNISVLVSRDLEFAPVEASR
jgi:type IV secretion system protein VirB10